MEPRKPEGEVVKALQSNFVQATFQLLAVAINASLIVRPGGPCAYGGAA